MSTTFPLMLNVYYHIYNRGINRENIFIEARNYRYFLQLYIKYIAPIADTYAYCLLPNHFHLLVRIKDKSDLTGFENLSGLKRPSQYFSNFFNAYSKAINAAYNRAGALIQRPFGRVAITANSQLFHLVAYIHQFHKNTALSLIFASGLIRHIGRYYPIKQPILNAKRCWTGLVVRVHLKTSTKC